MNKKVTVSVIIISKDNSRQENLMKLLGDISRQKIDAEVENLQVEGVSPSGKARNTGAAKARGDFLVFADNDIRIPDEHALAGLIQPLLEDEKIVGTFSSLLIPPDSTPFQRQYAKEIPRAQIPIVEKQTDAGALSTHFCAIRKDTFNNIGRFNEHLRRGVDPEISQRFKAAGLRLVLAAKVICFHPTPKNLTELITLHFRNGRSAAFADKYYPELNIDVNPESIIQAVRAQTKFSRIKRFLSQFIISIFSAKLLWTLSKISYICGYVHGLIMNRKE